MIRKIIIDQISQQMYSWRVTVMFTRGKARYFTFITYEGATTFVSSIVPEASSPQTIILKSKES